MRSGIRREVGGDRLTNSLNRGSSGISMKLVETSAVRFSVQIQTSLSARRLVNNDSSIVIKSVCVF